jgi:hypothetical protein
MLAGFPIQIISTESIGTGATPPFRREISAQKPKQGGSNLFPVALTRWFLASCAKI